MSEDSFWQSKLHARLHDPAEKALVLLRDPDGHEGGTVRALHDLVFTEEVPAPMHACVKRADWWAAAADRPQWPLQEITAGQGERQKTCKVAPEAKVHWTKEPVLIHPLTGKEFNLGNLGDTEIGDIKRKSREHFEALTHRDDNGGVDWQRTLAAYWRFGPELAEADADNEKLGLLWPLLPADTRVPDHSIWDHLDLTSAFAGAFAGDPDGDASLLALSLGPVQGFIASARSTSDLWAGSHLLSRLSWEAMKVICEALGPDAVLFPRLRGVPQVDAWLRDELKIDCARFDDLEWARRQTDANPLFRAALPNRFVAVVPASRARELAEAVQARTREWLHTLGERCLYRLLKTAGIDETPEPYCYAQMRRQLDGFPEVHWSAVPFSLIHARNAEKQTDLDTTGLSEAMAPFFGKSAAEASGFLDSPAWKVLRRAVDWDTNTRFFAPNPGVLYPAVYDLAERVLAASKSARSFRQSAERGYRDSLSGEVEWLAEDADQLNLPPGQRTDTLWARIAKENPAWAKAGEHLGALSAIKRLWPSLFAEEVAALTGGDKLQTPRFVVSTHTMALAQQMDAWLEAGPPSEALAAELASAPSVALPRRLMRHQKLPHFERARRLPGLLEKADESDDADAAQKMRTRIAGELSDDSSGESTIESYYALVQMDGDHMGRILSGDPHWATTYAQSFHPKTRAGFRKKAEQNPLLAEYGEQKRALSPGRHLAISGALNDFALHVVPEVIEQEHLGQLIYAGGDDVLAMLPVGQALNAADRLRRAYNGHDAADAERAPDWKAARRSQRMICRDGYALHGGRLYRMLGERATMSAGIVIAHCQAPLTAVRRELAAAERRAKQDGGRNAFSIALVKRSGGTAHFTAHWDEAIRPLARLVDFLRERDVSRRAVYHSLLWLRDLPSDAGKDMVGALLARQFRRQCARETTWKWHDAPGLAHQLAEAATRRGAGWKQWLSGLLTTAEFLARNGRGDVPAASDDAPSQSEHAA